MSRRVPFCDREPDPARCYERAKPEKEGGMGSLDCPPPDPANAPDCLERTVRNSHDSRQLNSDDEVKMIYEMESYRQRLTMD